MRRLRQIRRPVGQELVAQLVNSFVLSRLDYGRSSKVGDHAVSKRLERSSAADSRPTDERAVTPALRQLHWLPVDRRVDSKFCTMMHSIHTGQCPTYSSHMVRAVAVFATKAEVEITKWRPPNRKSV